MKNKTITISIIMMFIFVSAVLGYTSTCPTGYTLVENQCHSDTLNLNRDTDKIVPTNEDAAADKAAAEKAAKEAERKAKWYNAFKDGNNKDNGLDTFTFLSGFSNSLDGYPYISMFWNGKKDKNDNDNDEDMLIGKADNAFYTKVLGGKETFIAQMCRDPVSDLEDSTPTVVGGASGGDASAWMAGEKIPYDNYESGRKVSGFIYKISGEITYGYCKDMTVQLFIDEQPLIKADGTSSAYTFIMGTDSASAPISYTGQSMIRFFSQTEYNTVCASFIEPLSNGCLLNIYAPKKVCWNIITSDASAAAYVLANPKAAQPPANEPDPENPTATGDPVLNTKL